ncbi:EamA family transporter [Jiella sp. MQZ9-1]|uniref:EamA family transporter n=1 Tax=Jiella flava TaxID=2816857 RepID=A0A939JUN5_9HYPH|nr:DMT family transporter [Jiella flava]MBO0663365.1 EamA family transporter [Jiella flava]MCD2471941.1 EamA family transporter [Jiella flava]
MQTSRSHLWPGVPLALGAAILFGASAPFSKLLLGRIDPWLLAGILYIGAGIGLAAVHFGRHIIKLPQVEAPLQKTDLPWLAAVVAIGGGLGPLLLMFGLSLTSAASGSLLLNLEGLATMGIAWLVFKENVDRRLLLGAGAILAGAVMLTWNGQKFQFDWGGVLIAGACLAWGIDNNLTRKLSAADPVQIAMIKGLVAGTVNLAFAFSFGAGLPLASYIAAGAVVGFLGVGVSLVMFMLGLRHLGTARTGAYFSLAPFIGAALAIGLLGETMSAQFAVAGLLMALGLWLHLAERHDHEHRHEALEHDHAHVHDEHHKHAHSGPVIEPHTHFHRHEPMCHKHPHYPDLHHRHSHG